MALSFVRELAGLCSLSGDRTSSIELAVEEAVMNTISHAFEPGETGRITIVGEMDEAALYISIKDNGLPFDASLSNKYQTFSIDAIDNIPKRGLGFHLIENMVDEVCWMNHGREGKELRLTVYRSNTDISVTLSEEELTPYVTDAPLAPDQNYTIRLLQPEDGIRVGQCIYRTYGNTYPNEDLYYPERIAQQNQSGELISAVALDEQNEIVGHYALERPGKGNIAESGQAVVIPTHRGKKLMEKMRRFLEVEGQNKGLSGIFGQPVCKHLYSQKVNDRFGSRPCGINLGLLPGSFNFKKFESHSKNKRGSCMLYWKHLAAPQNRVIFTPPRHQDIIEQIYNSLDIPVQFEKPKPMPEIGNLKITSIKSWGFGTIRIETSGKNTFYELRRAQHDLINMTESEVIFLEIPLSQPGVDEVCNAAENYGFFFCGLGPYFYSDSDAIRMVYMKEQIDWDQLQILSPFGQTICQYSRNEYERIGQLSTTL